MSNFFHCSVINRVSVDATHGGYFSCSTTAMGVDYVPHRRTRVPRERRHSSNLWQEVLSSDNASRYGRDSCPNAENTFGLVAKTPGFALVKGRRRRTPACIKSLTGTSAPGAGRQNHYELSRSPSRSLRLVQTTWLPGQEPPGRTGPFRHNSADDSPRNDARGDRAASRGVCAPSQTTISNGVVVWPAEKRAS